MTKTAARSDGPARPAKRGPGRPRAQPLAQQRRGVIDAARAVFAQNGYHGATIEAVARRAGTPRPTVYELFGGKSGLFGAVLDDAADRVVKRLSAGYAESAELPLDAFVRHNFAVVFDLFEQDREAVVVLLAAEQGDADRPTSTTAEVRARVVSVISEYTRARWAALGVDIGTSAELLALIFFRMSEGLAVLHADGDGWDREALIDLLTEFTLGGLTRLWDQSLDVLLAAGRRGGTTGD
jgi:AcrR family transcriptional regulator